MAERPVTPVVGFLVDAPEGLFAPVDVELARALGRLGRAEPAALLAAALVSRATRDGRVHTRMSELTSSLAWELEALPASWPSEAAFEEAIAGAAIFGPADAQTPLVCDGGRLSLRRYHTYERWLLGALAERAREVIPIENEGRVRGTLDRLFGGPSSVLDRQRVACAVALTRALAIVTGGPGTGKTTTVARLLALLVEEARAAGKAPPIVSLAAPTGKAAARMVEALREAAGALVEAERLTPEVAALLPQTSSTIHRLLSPVAGRSTEFRKNARSPLDVDVLVIDESSMVDLALMAHLVEALPAGARLVLLGDKDQLGAVEVGSVFATLCEGGGHAFSAERARELEALTGAPVPVAEGAEAPRDHVVELEVSHRYPADSGIARVAAAVRRGLDDEARAALEVPAADVLALPLPAGADVEATLRDVVAQGFAPLLAARSPAEALEALGTFRILTPHREGPRGAAGLNALAERVLGARGAIEPGPRAYHRRPVIVTENEHRLGLFNGDVGVTWRTVDEAGSERLLVYFPGGHHAEPRAFSPARLPPHETVFAMTVHKAQGSELDELLLVFPDQASRVVTRELVYTAITRAKKRVVVAGRW